MYTLNRSAFVLKPKQPFVDWINALPGDDKYTIDQLRQESNVILLPEFQRPGDEIKYIKKVYSDLFTHQLWGWHTDESVWPEDRGWNLFQEWFEIQICSEVFDMVEGKIERDEV
jgi:hypothetical protein